MKKTPTPTPDNPVATPLARNPFAALLQRLAADNPSSGRAYEQLRRRVVIFFQLHVPVEAEALSDIVLDRLARRVDDGTQIVSLPLYALGIARLVLLESRAQARQQRVLHCDPTYAETVCDDDDDEHDRADAAAALQVCLNKLGKSGSDLMLAYYTGEGAQRIAERRRLAATLDIAANALRNRALRLREVLETCLRAGIGGSAPPLQRDKKRENHTGD